MSKGKDFEIVDALVSNDRKRKINVKSAIMPVERYASEYNMSHRNRGMAIILNHEFFDIPELDRRIGTMRDTESLEKSLTKLNFRVSVLKDLKLNEIVNELDAISRIDHTDNDCILVIVLTHGELGYLYSRDSQYKSDLIWSFFTPARCPTLAGKPKLFVLQACRGKLMDVGVSVRDRIETDGDSTTSYRIPLYADFLIAYSTVPGYVSWRNASKGTWFIQSLCAELDTNGYVYDILTLLTFVSQRVAIDFDMNQLKQIPCITSMLTRILRFQHY